MGGLLPDDLSGVLKELGPSEVADGVRGARGRRPHTGDGLERRRR